MVHASQLLMGNTWPRWEESSSCAVLPLRSLLASPGEPPVLVFTDGACEPAPDGKHLATVGGVIIVRGAAAQVRAFGCKVPDRLVARWAAQKRHLIGQTELYAAVLARFMWAKLLNDKRVLFFIDHSGVLGSCISGSASEPSCCTSKPLMRQAPACHGSLECRVTATLRTRRRGQSGRSLRSTVYIGPKILRPPTQDTMLHVFTIVFASTLSNLVAQSAHAGCVAPVLLQMQASSDHVSLSSAAKEQGPEKKELSATSSDLRKSPRWLEPCRWIQQTETGRRQFARSAQGHLQWFWRPGNLHSMIAGHGDCFQMTVWFK
eukprot:s6605_g4.t1